MEPQDERPEDEGPEDGSGSSQGLERGEFYRIAWTFYLVMAVAGVIWIGATRGLELSLFVDVDLPDLAIDLGLGLGVAAVLVGSWQLLRRRVAAMRELEATMRQMIGSLEAAEVFALALISGFSEELFFRGAVQSSWGWIWATLIFALLHTGPGRVFRVWTVFALVAGLAFAGLTLWRGNILPAIIAHLLVNWINLYSLMRGSDEEVVS